MIKPIELFSGLLRALDIRDVEFKENHDTKGVTVTKSSPESLAKIKQNITPVIKTAEGHSIAYLNLLQRVTRELQNNLPKKYPRASFKVSTSTFAPYEEGAFSAALVVETTNLNSNNPINLKKDLKEYLTFGLKSDESSERARFIITDIDALYRALEYFPTTPSLDTGDVKDVNNESTSRLTGSYSVSEALQHQPHRGLPPENTASNRTPPQNVESKELEAKIKKELIEKLLRLIPNQHPFNVGYKMENDKITLTFSFNAYHVNYIKDGGGREMEKDLNIQKYRKLVGIYLMENFRFNEKEARALLRHRSLENPDNSTDSPHFIYSIPLDKENFQKLLDRHSLKPSLETSTYPQSSPK